MSCNGKVFVTNDTAAAIDYKIRKGDMLAIYFDFCEDEAGTEPIDISDISFKMIVTLQNLVKLTLNDSDFIRVNTNAISRSYDAFSDLAKGNYTYKLIATYLDERVQTVATGDMNIF